MVVLLTQTESIMKPKTLPHPITAAILYYRSSGADGEDTAKCVKGIATALKTNGHKVRAVSVTHTNVRKVLSTPGDVVFNLVEDDGWVLYKRIGNALAKKGRIQFGHTKQSFAYAVDKVAMKRRLRAHDIATPPHRILNGNPTIRTSDLVYPLIIKPAHEHAGIGISQKSVVQNEKELHRQIDAIRKEIPGDIIVESFIDGREIHVTVIGNGNALHVLPLCEIGFKRKFRTHWGIYTYNAKWNKRSWEYHDARAHAPAGVTPALRKQINALALTAYTSLHCRDFARFDMRIDESDNPYIIDANINPSLNIYDPEDATILSMTALGWTYEQFIETLLTLAYTRKHH